MQGTATIDVNILTPEQRAIITEPIKKLNRDLRNTLKTEKMTRDQARFLVSLYYRMQQQRIRLAHQARTVGAAGSPVEVLVYFGEQFEVLEKQAKVALDIYSASEPTGIWARSILGVGPVLAAGLLAHISMEVWHCLDHEADPTVTACKKRDPRPADGSHSFCKLVPIKSAGSVWRFCLPAGTPVATPNGYTAIEKLAEGDLVFDKDGAATVVEATGGRKFTGHLITVKPRTLGPLTMTENHPVWSERDGVRAFRDASELQEGDLLLFPKLREEAKPLPGWDAPPKATGKQPILGGSVVLDEETAWLFGRYLADGSSSLYTEGKYERGNVAISIGESKVERDLGRVQAAAVRAFGSSRPFENVGATQVAVGRTSVAEKMREWFGDGAKTKRVPSWIYGADPQIVRQFVFGYLSGDGHESLTRGKYPYISASSASQELILGIQRLCASLGVQANVHLSLRAEGAAPEIRGRVIHQQRERWVLTINTTDLNVLKQSPVSTTPTHKWVSHDEAGRWCEVVDVAREFVTDFDVFDIQTGTESFVAANIAVHNSGLDATSVWGKGQKCPWNQDLKKLFFLIGESFVKVKSRPRDFYGKYYAIRKQIEQQKNERGEFADQAAVRATKVGKNTEAYKYYSKGQLPPAHIHARARRWAVKLFGSHYFEVAYWYHFGIRAPRPYAMAILGHAHEIDVPNAPWDGVKTEMAPEVEDIEDIIIDLPEDGIEEDERD